MKMKMPEIETAMMKCICNSCKSYEECMSMKTMKTMKAFCSTGVTMESMKKSDCMEMENMEHCMETMKEECMETMKEDCMCQECPVAEEYQLSDMIYCKT